MFKIVNTQGLVLELDPDEKITVEKNDPLFNDADKLLQDKSQSFKVPATENNKRFMKLAHLAEVNNSAYRQAVQVLYKGDVFLIGNLKCSVVEGNYEPNLEPNLVAINPLIKGIVMTDIPSNDSFLNIAPGGNPNGGDPVNFEEFDAFMLDTVVNPEKYPFYFLPVQNKVIVLDDLFLPYEWVNYFDKTAQRFRSFNAIESPFYKLPYMLKVIAGYLGLTPVGSFFSDPNWETVCIYTTQVTTIFYVLESMKYMPGIQLSEFLKQIRERFHICIDINLTTNEFTVETFKSISQSKARDISKWVTDYDQELPEAVYNKITLKTDEQDQAFAVTIDETTTYPALYQLTVGDGTTADVTLDAGTLKGIDLSTADVRGERFCQVNQFNYRDGVCANGHGDDYPDLSFSAKLSDYRQFNLRFIRFLGYNEIAPGVFYPESGPIELNDNDIAWNQFVNDSKRLTITANVPPAELATWKTTDKITIKTPGYNYIDLIIEKFSYDIGPNTDLVPVKIYARTLNFEPETTITITTINSAPDSDFAYTDGSIRVVKLVKAYFDPALHGITQVDFDFVVTEFPDVYGQYKSKPVLTPTNAKGAGGIPAYVYLVKNGDAGPAEIRVRSGHPKYLSINGQRFNFLPRDGYYYVSVTAYNDGIFFNDYYTIFY